MKVAIVHYWWLSNRGGEAVCTALVELFPTQVRYTALSVPYNIGVGWVGGLLPVSAFALVAARGDINAGLLYPLVFTLVSIVCALLFLPETRGARVTAAEIIREGA